jgi:hypothetical protein
MQLATQYERNEADPVHLRIASHFTNAHRRVGLVTHGTVPTQEQVAAQAHDLVHMTSDALGLLPGVGNIGDAGQVAFLLAHMQQMNNNLVAQMTQMNNNLIDLREDVAGLDRKLAVSINSNAVILNRGSFVPFQTANNEIPAGFPRTTAELMTLTGPQLTALLQAYNIDNIPHSLADRRERLTVLLTTGI